MNSTFDKKSEGGQGGQVQGGTSRTNLTFNNCDEQSNLLNGTFDKVTTKSSVIAMSDIITQRDGKDSLVLILTLKRNRT